MVLMNTGTALSPAVLNMPLMGDSKQQQQHQQLQLQQQLKSAQQQQQQTNNQHILLQQQVRCLDCERLRVDCLLTISFASPVGYLSAANDAG